MLFRSIFGVRESWAAMHYLSQFGIILGITFAGEALNYILPFPVPASIYGLLLLFLCLVFKIVKLCQVERAGDLLLSILPLTFLPVSARLLDLWDELRDILVPLLAISVVSTVVVMAVTGYTVQGIVRRKSGRGRIQ